MTTAPTTLNLHQVYNGRTSGTWRIIEGNTGMADYYPTPEDRAFLEAFRYELAENIWPLELNATDRSTIVMFEMLHIFSCSYGTAYRTVSNIYTMWQATGELNGTIEKALTTFLETYKTAEK